MAVPVRNRLGVIEAAVSVSVSSARESVATMEKELLPVLQRAGGWSERFKGGAISSSFGTRPRHTTNPANPSAALNATRKSGFRLAR